MKTLLSVIAILAVSFTLSARKQRTGPSRIVPVRVEQPAQADTSIIAADTIVSPSKSQIRFSGYDKQNRATKETFFVTNNLPDSVTITELEVTFTYMDMQGRMLHQATHKIECEIPHGQTRQLYVRSWDSNNAFHYYRSTPPQRRPSTPYKVTSSVTSALTRQPQ